MHIPSMQVAYKLASAITQVNKEFCYKKEFHCTLSKEEGKLLDDCGATKKVVLKMISLTG